MVNICAVVILSFLFASNFILLPIGIYRLIFPPCDRNIITEIPCDKLHLVTGSENIYYLHGCQITTTNTATYECQTFSTRSNTFKQCETSSRLLLSGRKLRSGAGGIHPKSKKKKSFVANAYSQINTHYENTLLNNKTFVLYPLEHKFRHFHQMKMPEYMGCCNNITSITSVKKELHFPFSLIGRYNNESGFVDDTCFNLMIGDIHERRMNMKENTLIILILGFMGLFYLCILFRTNRNQ